MSKKAIDCTKCRHGQKDPAGLGLWQCYNTGMPQVNRRGEPNPYGWPWGYDPAMVKSCTGYEEVSRGS